MTRHREINWRTNLLYIWLTQILTMAGFSSALPFIPIYIRDKWAITDEQTLGVWMSAFYFFGMLSFCISTPIWGILADRYGRKLMLLRACYVDALLFPCFILAPNPIILIVIRFITSAFTGTISAAQTLIVTTTPEEHHGFALGTLSSAVWSGNLIGVALGGIVVNNFGFTCAFLVCGGLYFAGGLLAQFFVHENFVPPVPMDTASDSISNTSGDKILQADKKADQEKNSGQTEGGAKRKRHRLREIPKAIWLLFLLIVIMALARRFEEPYVAMMVEKIHGPEDTALYTGWLSAIAAIGGIISGMGIGRLCDYYSPRKIAVPSVILASATMFIQAGAFSLPVFGGARFFNYLAAGGLEPVFMSLLAKVSPPSHRGTYFGFASAIRMFGILLSSIISGGVIYLAGIRNIYVTAGILFLLIIPFFYWTIRALPKNEE